MIRMPARAVTAPPRGRRIAITVGIVLAILTGVCVIAATVLDIIVGLSGRSTPVAAGWFATIPATALAIAGCAVLARRPEHPLALVMLGFAAVSSLSGLGSAWVNAAVTTWPELPLVAAALFVNQRLYAFLLLGIVAIFVLFPDGRLPGRPAARTLAIIASVVGILATLVHLTRPWDAIARRTGGPDWRVAEHYDPGWGIPLPPEVWDGIGVATEVAQFAAIGAAFASILLRSVGADLALRRQVRWVVWAAGLLVLVLVLWPVVPYEVGLGGMLVTFVVLCVAIAIATTRYRLASIDRVIGWTLLYTVLVIAVVVIDVVLLALVGSLIGEQTAAIVAAVIVLVAFAPLREPLLAAIQRIVYGRRGDPYGVVAGLADELERADAGDDQLEHIVRTVASAFGANYVRIRVVQPDGGFAESERGARPGEGADTVSAGGGSGGGSRGSATTRIPLTYRGESIGELELSQPRRVRLSRRDERLLADVVRQAAAAVRATIHGVELQRARAELVHAREAERRRLRRDVHDGLGPTLSAVKLRIDAARNVAPTDPAAADRILADASVLVTDAVADIRRIVDGLRPPALDDLGLRGAIERVCAPAGAGDVRVRLRYEVDAPLPAAVEVAALRIVAEALTNVRRHAGAEHADVNVVLDGGALLVEVADDGRGIDSVARGGEASTGGAGGAGDLARAPGSETGALPVVGPGLGLRSMRERARELDGSFAVTARPGGGTLVRAKLPLVGAVDAGVDDV